MRTRTQKIKFGQFFYEELVDPMAQTLLEENFFQSIRLIVLKSTGSDLRFQRKNGFKKIYANFILNIDLQGVS